jgi:hypothetical protein
MEVSRVEARAGVEPTYTDLQSCWTLDELYSDARKPASMLGDWLRIQCTTRAHFAGLGTISPGAARQLIHSSRKGALSNDRLHD